jgi:outer membrane protein assembly factor BamB
MSALYDLVDGTWNTTRAAAATRRELFVLDRDGSVWRIDPRTGEYIASLGDDFDGDHLVVLDGTAHVFRGPATALRGRIYTVEDRNLLAIDPSTGEAEVLDNTWDTRHLLAHGDHLFAWEDDNALYRVDPATGGAVPLDNNWPHVTGVASAVGRLYAVDNGIVYEIDPDTGGAEPVLDRMHTRLLVGCGSSLYSFEAHGDLVRIGVG